MSSLTGLKYFACLSTSVPHPTRPCGSQLSECIAHFWSFVFKHCVRAGEKVQPDDLSQSPGCLLWEERTNPCIILICQSTGILSGNKILSLC